MSDEQRSELRTCTHQTGLAPMLETVRAEVVTEERTWTAAQLAAWIAERHGVRLSADRLRRHLHRAKISLHRAKISWQRTSRTLRHTQNPDEVVERQAVREAYEKKGMRA